MNVSHASSRCKGSGPVLQKIAGLALLFVIATGQASTEGCAVPEEEAGAARTSDPRLPLEAYFHDQLDQNGDQLITGHEFESCDPHCTRYDRNGDGRVTWAEFLADPMDVSSAIEMIFGGPQYFVEERAALDADGDGDVTWKEFYNPQMARFAPNNYDPKTATWRADPAPQEASATLSDTEIYEFQFGLNDVTEDGWLSGTELDTCGCRHYDMDRDGEITRKEFLAGRIMQKAGVEIAAAPAQPSPGPSRPQPQPRAQPEPTPEPHPTPGPVAAGGPPVGK